MEIEEFVPNSYIAACGDTGKVACINMDNAEQDCDSNGDATAGNHTINSINGYTRVWVIKNNGTHINAIIDPNYEEKDSMNHFISIKTINVSN